MRDVATAAPFVSDLVAQDVNRLKMAHEGSMFTWGAVVYF
jgi:hypothetical protein